MAAKESTATLDFHPSRVGFGMRYRKRGTLGGFVKGKVKAAEVKIGKFKVPRTPWWSRKAVGRVKVPSFWREIRCGSQILR